MPIEYYIIVSIPSFIRFAHVINYLLILGGKEGLSDLIIHKLSSRLICLNFPPEELQEEIDIRFSIRFRWLSDAKIDHQKYF